MTGRKIKTPSPVRRVESFINQVDLEPTKEVFMAMHSVSLLILIFVLAAAICWMYYVAKAVDNNAIGGKYGKGEDDNGGEVRQMDTIRVMFQAVVASTLLYFVARHHYRSHY